MITSRALASSIVLVLALSHLDKNVNGLSQQPTTTTTTTTTRRNVIQKGAISFFTTATAFTLGTTTATATATAASDTTTSSSMTTSATTDNNGKPKEFINVGQQAPPPDGENAFITLENGVKIKDFKVGMTNDNNTVTPTSQSVMVQCTGRLLNLNGVVFYSTKNNNPDGFGPVPLTLNLGKGEIIPGLESGMVGMKKGSIRRIIIPPDLAYSNYPNLEPKPVSTIDQRALDSVVKNTRRDATIMFDVQVERFK
jgi:FKBP-type peptidyl-prolyl cis-trans isomerase